MKKVYETPEAKLICFQALESIALLEHDDSVNTRSVDRPIDPGSNMGVIEGGRD